MLLPEIRQIKSIDLLTIDCDMHDFEFSITSWMNSCSEHKWFIENVQKCVCKYKSNQTGLSTSILAGWND